MRSRAIVGLFGACVAASAIAYAHAPGVTHSYENGQPVITVRLVPEEAAVAKAKGPEPMAAESDRTAPEGEPGVSGVEAAQSVPSQAQQDIGVPLDVEPAPETPSLSQSTAPDTSASVSRYPTARPALKPDTETGVGGALDLAPPAAAETPQPRPMRLNSVQRPRTVAERAPRPQREPAPRPQRVWKEPAAPATPDPLDEALPSRIVLDSEPVNAMRLPAPKSDERLAGGN